MIPQPAARDTTFDNVIPEKVWISHRTTPDRKYIVCYLEINGIEKELSRFYVHDYDGIISESTQLTWILKLNDRKTELETLIRGHMEAMRPLLDEWAKL